jgi:hypothetical protein
MSTDLNKHLNCVLESHKIKKEQVLLDKHISKRDEIKEALEEKYGANIYTPFNSGSYAKNTAINKKFDFDFIVPFRRDAFDTLEKMFNDVYDFIEEKYRKEANIKKQKVSIGLEFYPDENGDIVKIDLVPGRELNKGQYDKDNKLNLYVNLTFGKLNAGSDYIRSNIQAQVAIIKDRATKEKETIRSLIRLLKVWKINRNQQIKSFFIELITIKAVDNLKISGDLWERLKMVLEFIRDEVKTVTLPDPGNSANEVADTLTDYEKVALSDDMMYLLERVEENSDNIKIYFPVNEKHPCTDEKNDDNKYEIKKEGVFVPPSVRFG